MDIQIKKLSPHDIHDFSKLIEVFAVVFEMDDFKTPDDAYLQSLLNKPDFFVLVATFENSVIGGLTVYILHGYYSQKPTAYIYDVGVLSDYQRKGIGKKLIAYLTRYCKENGFEEAFVQAETDDLHAINFYRMTSISNELQATHFTYSVEKAKDDNKVPSNERKTNR